MAKKTIKTEAFELLYPEKQTCFIASIPHSGTFIPDEAKQAFTEEHTAALINTDWYIDLLFDFLPELGFTVIKNNIYRYVIDVNREIKAPIFGDFWKCAIPSNSPKGTPCHWPLYRQRPSLAEQKKRVRLYHQSYHNTLKAEIEKLTDKFGKAYLFDLHSFIGGIPNEVCLGNRKGITSDVGFMEFLCSKFIEQGFDTVLNKKFIGGHITQKYHRKGIINSLQVELKSSLIIDESELDKAKPPLLNPNKFNKTQSKLKPIFKEIVESIENKKRLPG